MRFFLCHLFITNKIILLMFFLIKIRKKGLGMNHKGNDEG